MFEWLFSWEVTSWVVAGAIAVALGVLALDDFRLAKLFFIIAAADAAGGIAMWGIKTTRPTWLSALTAGLLVGAIAAMTIFVFRYVDGKEQKKKVGDSSESKKEPYDIDVNTALLSPIRQHGCGWWLVSSLPVGSNYIASPANVAIYASIINQQSNPAIVRNVKVEMRTASGEWAQLFRLDTIGSSAFFGMNAKESRAIIDNSVLLDRLIFERSLEPYKPVMGWLLFEYPKEYGPTFLGEFRVTIHDSAGAEYISPVLSSSPGIGNTKMQGGYIPVSTVLTDLTRFDMLYQSDRAPFVP
jgi:hypothetical protein